MKKQDSVDVAVLNRLELDTDETRQQYQETIHNMLLKNAH